MCNLCICNKKYSIKVSVFEDEVISFILPFMGYEISLFLKLSHPVSQVFVLKTVKFYKEVALTKRKKICG